MWTKLWLYWLYVNGQTWELINLGQPRKIVFPWKISQRIVLPLHFSIYFVGFSFRSKLQVLGRPWERSPFIGNRKWALELSGENLPRSWRMGKGKKDRKEIHGFSSAMSANIILIVIPMILHGLQRK